MFFTGCNADGGQVVARWIKLMPRLETLRLGVCDMQQTAVFEAIRDAKHLQTLELEFEFLDETAAAAETAAAKALRRKNESEAVARCLRVLQKRKEPTLRHLSIEMWSNGGKMKLTPAPFAALARILRANVHLERLDLHMGNAKIDALVDSISTLVRALPTGLCTLGLDAYQADAHSVARLLMRKVRHDAELVDLGSERLLKGMYHDVLSPDDPDYSLHEDLDADRPRSSDEDSDSDIAPFDMTDEDEEDEGEDKDEKKNQ